MKISKKFFSVSSLPKYLLAWVIIVSVAFSGFFYYQWNSFRAQNIDNAKGEIRRLVKVVAGNTALSFLSVDRTLRRTEERLYFNSLFGNTLLQDIEHNLKLWVNETPLLDALLMVDENGVVKAVSKKSFSKLDIKNGDIFSAKKHFKHHRSTENEEMFITPLKEGNEKDHHRVLVSRPLKKVDGKFDGLVFAIMSGYYLTDFFQSIEVGNFTQLGILLDDRDLLVKDSGFEPNLEKLRDTIYKNNFNNAFNNSTQLTEANYDGKLSLYAYKKIPNLPISVSIVMNEEDIFASWKQTKENYIVFLSVFTGFTATILFFLYLLGRQINQVEKSEQAAIMASQAKSDFLAKMSHELRTPLNAIIGFSDMLKAGYFGNLADPQIERINDINMCGNHLLTFINDILEFSKGDAGKMELEEGSFQLSDVINQSLRMINQRAKSGGVEILNRTGTDIVQIYADSRKIKQIIINLLSNAVKFTPSGGRITILSGINKGGSFYLSIEDTGAGIPKDEIPKAMSVFEQVHKADGFEGTGLGLPLCKMLTELHDGEFILESEVGKGTKATFTLGKERIISYTSSQQKELKIA